MSLADARGSQAHVSREPIWVAASVNLTYCPMDLRRARHRPCVDSLVELHKPHDQLRRDLARELQSDVSTKAVEVSAAIGEHARQVVQTIAESRNRHLQGKLPQSVEADVALRALNVRNDPGQPGCKVLCLGVQHGS